MTVPTELSYTAQHEWIKNDGDLVTIGITQYAADALGDVVYLDLPAVGATITAGEVCGEIESTKSVSDLFAPADGDVAQVNESAVADPGLVNTDPYGQGWLLKLRIDRMPDVLDAAAYERLLGAGA
ncbi:glycine cleavage system protein GcvH [Nocardioides bigeumensis]|uniref:Glycine cleavage system H protein n=1 Tax=Nocardioides bigeumensis TaxID=433657 RepID=A0ABN2YPM1_9ACTN